MRRETRIKPIGRASAQASDGKKVRGVGAIASCELKDDNNGLAENGQGDLSNQRDLGMDGGAGRRVTGSTVPPRCRGRRQTGAT